MMRFTFSEFNEVVPIAGEEQASILISKAENGFIRFEERTRLWREKSAFSIPLPTVIGYHHPGRRTNYGERRP